MLQAAHLGEESLSALCTGFATRRFPVSCPRIEAACVAQRALRLLRVPDSGDRDLLGHVRGGVVDELEDIPDGLRGLGRCRRLEQAPLMHAAAVPLARLG